MSKTLLIIGGSSFFGLSIIEFISKNDLELKKKIKNVIVLYRNQKKIIKKKSKYINFTYLKKNFINLNSLPKADYIIYLLRFDKSADDIHAFEKFLKILKKSNIKTKILYTSSGAVYKNFSNQVKIKTPHFDYARTKIINEKKLRAFSSSRAKCISARCYAFVGKYLPLKSNFVIGNIIYSIIKKKKIVLKSSKDILRSYMYADDLANILIKILFSSKKKYVSYDIGSTDVISIQKISRFFSKKYNLKLDIKKKKNIIEKDEYFPNIRNIYPNFKPKFHKSLDAIKKTIDELGSSNIYY